jgi:plastocyanin
MNKIRTSKFVSLGSALVVVAILSVVTLRASSSPSKPGSDSKPASAAGAGTSTQPAADVKIDNFAFTPVAVTVKVGTEVTWINHDDIPHTVDSTDGKFKSAALDTDDKFQFRFTEPGEYPFYCRIHPKMTGKIIVQP